MSKCFETSDISFSDIDLFEINEAFAAQVLACHKAADSTEFAKTYLNKSKKVGTLDPKKCNVNGGAIAQGHPVGTSGTRIVLTLLHELKRQNKTLGCASLCVGGGQGGAVIIERH
jgi:acetyl-CoA acetyltransferase